MKLPAPRFDIQYIPMVGGEDLLTPSLSVKPGRAIFTKNYELDLEGRYRLIDGYEAFDGQPKPSNASYWVLYYDNGSVVINIGDILDGAGGASAEVLYSYITSGSIVGGDAAGYVILFNFNGTSYVDDEVLSVSATPVATANGTEEEQGETDHDFHLVYLLEAIEATRDDIAAVPGSGSVLGVWQYSGVVYAFRNNSGGTAAVMHKSSSSGWQAVDLGERLPFDTGSVEFVEGETITQGGVTSVCRRVVVTSGTWAGNDAAGYFTISGRSGGNYAAGAITGSVAGAANATGVQVANTLSPGGSYKFINSNFGGSAGTKRMYGCDGVNKAFEWDGTYFTFVTTGMSSDAPIDIIEHRNHLFLAFSGGSLQHSGPGTPFVWSVVLGANEIGLGDEITGLLSMKSVLAVFGRNKTKLLYGTSVSDWDFRPHSDESGAIANTVQKIGPGIYVDDRGMTSITATDQYGDFQQNVISKSIQSFLKPKLGNVQTSVRVKEKNQYRLIFDDMQAITLTMDANRVSGFTRQLYDKLPTCICSNENSSGQEEIYFGSTDGFVYQMDSGNSLNGNAIEAIIKLHFNHLKSPRVKKRIRKIILELEAPANTYLQGNVEFDFGDMGNPAEMFAAEDTGGLWDVAEWDDFYWDAGQTSSLPMDINGTGMNFSLTIYCSGNFELQSAGSVLTGITGAGSHTLQGYIVHFDYRGIQR